MCIERLPDFLSRFSQNFCCRLPEDMTTEGIAKVGAQTKRHRLSDRGCHRCGGIVVKINHILEASRTGRHFCLPSLTSIRLCTKVTFTNDRAIPHACSGKYQKLQQI
mmetsp:Transcript_7314/g.14307  ORF Transcript_7314/g.14307 Transcript_7314/m.14307 type:complete len:107 (-) Transcript_7314:17-337(-)